MDELQRERKRSVVVQRERLAQVHLRSVVERAEEVFAGGDQRDSGAEAGARSHDTHLRVEDHEEIRRPLDQECVETLHVRRLPLG